MTSAMQWMRSLVGSGMLLSLLYLPSMAHAADAQPQEFQGANLMKGQQLYTDLKCAACHAERMMGSASAMYTRSDRKVHNPKQLLAFTQMCVTQLNHNLFPEEVKDIAAYLNQTYYKFK